MSYWNRTNVFRVRSKGDHPFRAKATFYGKLIFLIYPLIRTRTCTYQEKGNISLTLNVK